MEPNRTKSVTPRKFAFVNLFLLSGSQPPRVDFCSVDLIAEIFARFRRSHRTESVETWSVLNGVWWREQCSEERFEFVRRTLGTARGEKLFPGDISTGWNFTVETVKIFGFLTLSFCRHSAIVVRRLKKKNREFSSDLSLSLSLSRPVRPELLSRSDHFFLPTPLFNFSLYSLFLLTLLCLFKKKKKKNLQIGFQPKRCTSARSIELLRPATTPPATFRSFAPRSPLIFPVPLSPPAAQQIAGRDDQNRRHRRLSVRGFPAKFLLKIGMVLLSLTSPIVLSNLFPDLSNIPADRSIAPFVFNSVFW